MFQFSDETKKRIIMRRIKSFRHTFETFDEDIERIWGADFRTALMDICDDIDDSINRIDNPIDPKDPTGGQR